MALAPQFSDRAYSIETRSKASIMPGVERRWLEREARMTALAFASILDAARTRLGAAALEARLTKPHSPAELKAQTDDRYLSQMELRIFRAGLKHSVVDAKWPAFEEVFDQFEPRRVRAMSDEALEALLGDSRLIRHWGKLKSVRDN